MVYKRCACQSARRICLFSFRRNIFTASSKISLRCLFLFSDIFPRKLCFFNNSFHTFIPSHILYSCDTFSPSISKQASTSRRRILQPAKMKFSVETTLLLLLSSIADSHTIPKRQSTDLVDTTITSPPKLSLWQALEKRRGGGGRGGGVSSGSGGGSGGRTGSGSRGGSSGGSRGDSTR